jgi:hypothetical protein
MNLVKNIFRSLLQPQILRKVMMIKMNGPSLTEFSPANALDQWLFSSKTLRHVSGHKRQNDK